jgi:hypothetical protein
MASMSWMEKGWVSAADKPAGSVWAKRIRTQKKRKLRINSSSPQMMFLKKDIYF